MPDYTYQEPNKAAFGPLAAGQYPFRVIEIADPYTSKNGNFVVPVKLEVGSEKIHVYDNPSAGVGKNGPYDNIAAFLKSIGRAPQPGQRVNFSRQNIVGARGEVMLKVETAAKGNLAGKPVNKVHYYIWDQPAGKGTNSIVPAQQMHKGEDPDNLPF